MSEIQKELNPRLDVVDFLELVNSRDTRSNVLVVDARSNSE